MMTRIKLVALLLLATLQGYSHALWIKTEAVGKIGQAQTVTVIYSEPDESPEKLNDWYSDVKEFELWLTGPDGNKEKLSLKADSDRYTASFTPNKEGLYVISAGKTAKDLGGTTVYQFNASAVVRVGKIQPQQKSPLAANDLVLTADLQSKNKVKTPVKLQTYFNGQPVREKVHVSVTAPSGWSKNLTTDENGVAEFLPEWPGDYALEVSKSWKTEGEHNGKPYKAFWRCATLTVPVSK